MLTLRTPYRKLHSSLATKGVLGTWLALGRAVIKAVQKNTPASRRKLAKSRKFDRERGIDTAGIISLHALDIEDRQQREQCNHYQPTPPDQVHSILSSLPLRYETFSFVDFGSGKGRVLLLASEYPFREIIGFELSQKLHETATANIRCYRSPTQKCKNIRSICADAATAEIPEESAIFYFYNPFQRAVFERVVANISSSFAKHPREMYVILYEPCFTEVLDQSGFFERMSANNNWAIWRTTCGSERGSR